MDVAGLFTPFQNQDLCLWFYFLSVAGFVLLVFTIIAFIYYGITQKKNAVSFFSLSLAVSWYLIFYFQNRLLYTMCVKSV